MSCKRYDFHPLGKPTKTKEGFLKVPVFATRSGVFNYIQQDGTVVREFRPPEEVFKKDSMNTLSGMPFTNRHPTVLLDSQNAKDFMVGFTDTVVEKNGDKVATGVTITDQSMIDEIEKEDGLREVSCGYTCDLDFTPGMTTDGEKYDAIQRNISYNHLAGVDRGRAGSEVRLRMDSNSAILDDKQQETDKTNKKTNSNTKGDYMVKITLDGMEFEVEGSLAQAINSTLKTSKMDGETSVREELKTTLEKAKTDATEVSTLQAKVDTLEEENKTLKESKSDDKDIHAKVIARAALVETAKAVLDDETKFDEMSDLDIKKAVIVAKTNLDAESEKLNDEIYVDARFDGITETIEAEKADGNADLKAELGKKAGKADGGELVDAEKIRKTNMDADAKAWEKPTGFTLN